MLPLQSCIDLLDIESALCGETYDGNQVTDIKVEGVTNEQQEEDPLLITCPVKQTEHEVSCLSVCVLLGTSCVWFL
jgi:hypothetical protein